MKNFIIIGSSGGIGNQLVADLGNTENQLLLGYHSDKSRNHLPNTISAPVEAQSFSSVEALVELGLNEFGKIDGVVNLPGSVLLKPPHLISEIEFNQTIEINLKSAFATLRACGKLLSDSSIVLMSTAVTALGLKNHELIVAAKAGIEAMVRSASVSYSRKSLRFNAVAPGLVDTPLTKNITGNEFALEVSKKMHIIKRIGTAADISNMIKFLLNSENNWITGQTFTVDGGLSSTKETYK
ncbi:MAG: hypothetical protein CMG22_02520 [Candidatus Marinimicrobia bacterium]|nr:hypothetical protein [Candidatus Neomarinimicrobiota bacterium]